MIPTLSPCFSRLLCIIVILSHQLQRTLKGVDTVVPTTECNDNTLFTALFPPHRDVRQTRLDKAKEREGTAEG